MKKTILLLLSLLLSLGLLAGCGAASTASSAPSVPQEQAAQPSSSEVPDEEPVDAPSEAAVPVLPEVTRVAALKGPTAMGMVKLMQDSEDGVAELDYDFLLTSIDEIVPKISKGEVDIAAVPANLSSVLYNNTEGKVQVLAINTLGVLYVVEKGDSISAVADLKGKVIYAAGKGAIPEFALNHVLSQNGIDPNKDITIEFKSEPAEIIPLLAQNDNAIALLPQPFVTVALSRVEGTRVALDWTEEWDEISEDGSALLTGVMVVRREFAEQYPDAVELFCKEYSASTEYAQKNVAETAQLVGKYEIVDAAVAEKALPDCNIVFIDGDDMKDSLAGYLAALYEQDPKSVGGKLPDDGYYYSR